MNEKDILMQLIEKISKTNIEDVKKITNYEVNRNYSTIEVHSISADLNDGRSIRVSITFPAGEKQ